MDPFTMYLAGQLLGAVGGAASSGQQQKLTKEQMAEQAREFNAQQNFTQHMGEVSNSFGQVKGINDLQHQIETAPLRDKTLYMLNQRMGMVPQNFNPRDMMNPQSSGNQTPSQGGIDPAKLQAAMQTYQAPDFKNYRTGSGGVNPQMYDLLLSKLGLQGGAANPHGLGDVIANTTNVSGGPWDPPKQQNAGGQPVGSGGYNPAGSSGLTPAGQGPGGWSNGWGGSPGSTPNGQPYVPPQTPSSIKPSFSGSFQPLTMRRQY